MEEDKELNKIVMNLVELCEKKGVVGVERVINDYQIHFRFVKLKKSSKEGVTEKVGDTLTNMGDEITNSFIGKR